MVLFAYLQGIQVGMGPAGELRYPSCPIQKLTWAWRTRELGEFQCYDKVGRAFPALSIGMRLYLTQGISSYTINFAHLCILVLGCILFSTCIRLFSCSIFFETIVLLFYFPVHACIFECLCSSNWKERVGK